MISDQREEFNHKFDKVLKDLDLAYSRKENQIFFLEEMLQFIEFAKSNWYFMKESMDSSSFLKLYDIFLIDNSYSFGFFKFISESVDQICRIFYPIMFITHLISQFSVLFRYENGQRISVIVFASLTLFYFIVKIRHIMWDKYLFFSGTLKYMFLCTFCRRKEKIELYRFD